MTGPHRDSQEAYDRAVGATDPLIGLQQIATLRESLVRWEADLARAALAGGATWEAIGQALGTSRQAAWERLRPGVAASISSDRAQLEGRRSALEQERTKRGRR